MKSINYELRYDGATAGQVHTMLQDPVFREQVCDFQQVLRRTVTITVAGAGMNVKLDQVQAARGIPSFAKKIVGEEINIVHEEQWSSPTDGTLKIAIPGKPGDIAGDIHLAEDDAGTTETVRMDVKVSIPLVGGKIESLLAELLTKALRAENVVGREWLAQRG